MLSLLTTLRTYDHNGNSVLTRTNFTREMTTMLDDRTSTKPRNMSFKAYKEMKLKMLKDFCIKLTDKQLEHFNELKTEIAIDNFCISAIRESYE